MKTFSVHAPKELSGEALVDGPRYMFVKEGMCWLAFLITLPWLIWNRMWLVLIGYCIILGGIFGLTGGSAELAIYASGLSGLINFLVGIEGNNLKRWQLGRKGFVEVGVVSGRTLEECELRYFTGEVSRLSAYRDNGPAARSDDGTSTVVPA